MFVLKISSYNIALLPSVISGNINFRLLFFSLKKKFRLQGCRSESSLGGKSTVLELGTPEEEEVRKYIIILIYPHQILDSSVPSLLISSGTS